MEHQAFRYDFTWRELRYFCFSKKICPRCNGKMNKRKGFETAEGAKFNSKADPFFASNAKVKHYIYFFICQDCGRQYTLAELAKKG